MTRRRVVTALAATAALAAPPLASAQTVSVPDRVAAPTAAAAAQEPPAATPAQEGAAGQGGERERAGGRIGVRLEAGVYRVGDAALTVPGRAVRISGRIVPYVPGQTVTVRVWNGSRLAKRVTVTPRPTRTRRTATFQARFTAGRTGRVSVFAIHPRTAEQRRLVSRAASVDVVTPAASFGARGPFVALLQRKLAELGYRVPRTGVYDAGTGRAIEAFRKVNGLARVQTADPVVVDRLLREVGGFRVRYPGHGRHVEANLSQQVLALIENGVVVAAYTTSSGAPATPTVLGSYRFYWKQPGVNNKEMVHSAYFIRGYAIHGYTSVPPYPASHGCLRVPIPNALEIFNWVRIGDRIDVYY